MFDLPRRLSLSCKRISLRPIMGKAMPDRITMPFVALNRFDMLHRAASGDGIIAPVRTSISTTMTMTTSAMRGQVGVD
tara:strand:+ start:443 stop:676 length:234 start_codon:yes stop_codon:yes gene_type:complete